MENGVLEPLELSKTMAEVVPFEVGFHFLINVLFLLNGNFFLFIFNIPLLVFHIRFMQKKEYLFYAITANEYTDKDRNRQIYKYKMAFYSALILFVLLRFMFVFSNFAIYNLFGNDYTIVFFEDWSQFPLLK